jgi:hypothetical protein
MAWPVINVKDSPYNAVGDGSTDDTTALQAVATAVNGDGGNATVVFPTGIYRITAAIDWGSDVRGLTITGNAYPAVWETPDGASSILIDPASGSIAGFKFGRDIENLTITRLGFIGGGPSILVRDPLAAAGAAYREILISDCNFGTLANTTAHIWFGQELDAGVDADAVGFAIERCAFGPSATSFGTFEGTRGIVVVGGGNWYGFRVRDCRFCMWQAIRTQHMNIVDVTNAIITTAWTNDGVPTVKPHQVEIDGGKGPNYFRSIYAETGYPSEPANDPPPPPNPKPQPRFLKIYNMTASDNEAVVVEDLAVNSSEPMTDSLIDSTSFLFLRNVKASWTPSGGPNVVRNINANDGYQAFNDPRCPDTYTIGTGAVSAGGPWPSVTPTLDVVGTGSWSASGGDVVTFAYQVLGKRMTVAFYINSATVSGNPSALKIQIPAGRSAAKDMATMGHYKTQPTGGGALDKGPLWLQVAANDTWMYLYRGFYGAGGAWPTSDADSTGVFGEITFEIK